jgi:NADH:ubiquinone oxidoreductase subunit 6 (subunit J)
MSFCLFAETESARGLGPFLRENWFVVLPCALGFAAIYLMLPGARRTRPAWAGGLAGLALALGAITLVRTGASTIETVLFLAFAGAAVTAGVVMITQSNPVHAALSFALVVLSTCGLFLLLAAPFLMAATIIVYAGAIVVTFLFVIMLAQQEGASNADQRSREPFLACLAGCVLLAALLCILHRTYQLSDLESVVKQLTQLGDVKDKDEIKRLLGDPEVKKERTLPLVEQLKKHFATVPEDRAVHNRVANIQLDWVRLDVEKLKSDAKAVLEELEPQRDRQGTLALGTVPGKAKTPSQFKPGELPASNVAAIGKTLFTDYLIPVELAATLLLVATIGAIVIAGRRSEELR